jgi:threonine aldolase
MSTLPYGVIDLRSDTVTRPSEAMRRAMLAAEVGDDVLGDDPTVIRLQERIAEMMGKPAACFVPSGTMANQTAIRAHTEPGDEVLAHKDSHIIHYETGSPAALSGVMVRPLDGPRGLFDAEQIEPRPYASHFARTRLVVIENTHNRGGGAVWPIEQIRSVTGRAREHKLHLHLDGARIWNACAASGLRPADYAQHFDTVSCCFSKGLGAPVGSAVAGEKETIFRIHRFRKMFGGSMRQAGLLAAAALHALEHHRERLVEDHHNARRLAERIAQIPGLSIPLPVETNMVFFDIDGAVVGGGGRSGGGWTAAELCQRLTSECVWMLPVGPQRVRAVCHLDVSAPMIDTAADVLERVCVIVQ